MDRTDVLGVDQGAAVSRPPGLSVRDCERLADVVEAFAAANA
jgi:hypothetical protein